MARFPHAVRGIVLAVLFTAPTAAQADDKDTIDYRQNLMKTMGAQSAAVGAIVQNKVPYSENLAIHAEIIAINARAAVKAFEANVVGGTATAAIWENWGDFSSRFVALAEAADAVAKAARENPGAQDPRQVMSMFTCKGCHDTYRTK